MVPLRGKPAVLVLIAPVHLQQIPAGDISRDHLPPESVGLKPVRVCDNCQPVRICGGSLRGRFRKSRGSLRVRFRKSTGPLRILPAIFALYSFREVFLNITFVPT